MSEQTDTRTPEQIRQDIEQTREELADTAAALAHKADVKARAQEHVDELKSNVSERVQDVKSKVTGATPASVSSGAQSAAGSTKDVVRAKPLPAAAVAAALLGFALGYHMARRRG